MKLKSIMSLLFAVSTPLFMAEEAAGSAGSAKRPKFCSKEYEIDTGLASFEFGNGTTLELNVYELPEETQKQLMLHGALQKVGDSYAGAKGDFGTGVSSAQSVIDQLKAGEWTGGGDAVGRPRIKDLAEALARVKGMSVEEVTPIVEAAAALNGSDEERKAGKEKLQAWRSNAKVKAALAAIAAEKAQKVAEAQGDQAEEPQLQ